MATLTLAQATAFVNAPGNRSLVLDRLVPAVVEAAMTVSAEPNTTANYTNRQKWCNRVFATPDSAVTMAQTMLLAVITTAPISTDIAGGLNPSDADILSVVASLVNAFAGQV